MEFIEKNCPLIDRQCDKEKCVAYHVYIDTYYSTSGVEQTIIEAKTMENKKERKHEYAINEAIIDKEIINTTHMCKQYNLNFTEITEKATNIPIITHECNLKYNGKFVQIRNDNINITTNTPNPSGYGWDSKTEYSEYYKKNYKPLTV